MSPEEVEKLEVEIEKNQAAEDALHRKKNVPKYTEKEVQEHLHELNLTNEPKLRMQRHEWFVLRKIRLVFCEGVAFLCPEETNSSEVLSRLDAMNKARLELIEQNKWMKKHGLNVELVERRYLLRKCVQKEEESV